MCVCVCVKCSHASVLEINKIKGDRVPNCITAYGIYYDMSISGLKIKLSHLDLKNCIILEGKHFMWI